MVTIDGDGLIFILSAPRAGSTLLAAILGNHTQVLCPPEPWLLLPLSAICSRDAEIIAVYDHELARKAWQELASNDVFEQAFRAFAITVYNALLKQSGKHLIVDKTPRYYHILPWLDTIFPRARKIWLRRNPLDIIASCKKTWGLTIKELLGKVISPYTFDVTVSFTLLADYFERTTSQHYVLYYEELVRDPSNHIKALCDFIGLPYEESLVSYGTNRSLMEIYANSVMGDKKVTRHNKPHTNSVGRWRKILTPVEVREVLLTLGRLTFERQGYGSVIEEAASLVGFNLSEVDEKGEMDRIFQQYALYVNGNLPDSAGGYRSLIEREIVDLRTRLTESEADRAARLAVIEKQGAEIAHLQAEVHRWLEESQALWQRIGELEAERNTLQAQLVDLQRQVDLQAHRIQLQEEQLQIVSSHLKTFQRLFTAIQRGRVYRLVRSLGGWDWVEQMLVSTGSPDSLLSRVELAVDPAGVLNCSVPSQAHVTSSMSGREPLDPAEEAFAAIREPKKRGGVLFTAGAEERIVWRLERLGLVVQKYAVDIADFHRYFAAARYREDFPNYYPFNLPEKALEHYMAAVLLQLNEQDIYIDIASEHSPVPDIYHRLYGAKTYRQDLAYPAGLNGNMIGSDAANMPLPDGFATKMALHCSFEHFEGNSDIGFIREAARVLRPGGAVCIVPLYLYEEYAIQTDPLVAVSAGLAFEDDATIYAAQGWGNRHGRFYDPEHLVSRVYSNLGDMTAEIYLVTNAQQVDPSCYLRFALLIKKPLAA